MSSDQGEPTPQEREIRDREAKAREEQEQAGMQVWRCGQLCLIYALR